MGTVPPPANGLASNYNYFLGSNCAPLRDVSVIIALTQAISSNIGFSFQLNAMTPSLTTGCKWQQYVFRVRPSGADTVLECRTDYFPASGPDNLTSYIPLGTLSPNSADNPTLPAGYQVIIGLINDGSGNVIGVTFLLVDGVGGHVADSGPVQLNGTPTPISSFELNIVGPVAGLEAYLLSGAGNITYTAQSPLTVLNAPLPGCTADPTVITGETANSAYGALDAGPFPPGTPVVQTFTTPQQSPYPAGGAFAVAPQVGTSNTNLYVIDKVGQLAVFTVNGGGHWGSLMPLGPTGMARRHTAIAVSPQFGANNQTDVFLVDQGGQLQTFWVEGAGAW